MRGSWSCGGSDRERCAVDIWELSDLSTPWAIHVVVTLRVAEYLQAGKSEIGELAVATGADRRYLHRVLRHVVTKGVFTEPEPGRFAMNDAAMPLLGTGIQLGMNLDGFGGRMAGAWGTMLAAVRAGRPAYDQAFGRPFWDDLDAHPEIAEQFDDLMGLAGHGTPDPDVLLNEEDWASIRTVVDVGGGTGALLAEILRARPGVRGTLVDLEKTVARSSAVFAAAGVQDRVTVAGQSFFEPLPAGADLYILKKVLSNWEEREATEILRRCAEAARPNGRVVAFISERASPELLMMVLLGAREYELEEFREMARDAGLTVTASGRQRSGKFLAECRPL